MKTADEKRRPAGSRSGGDAGNVGGTLPHGGTSVKEKRVELAEIHDEELRLFRRIRVATRKILRLEKRREAVLAQIAEEAQP